MRHVEVEDDEVGLNPGELFLQPADVGDGGDRSIAGMPQHPVINRRFELSSSMTRMWAAVRSNSSRSELPNSGSVGRANRSGDCLDTR